MTKHAAEPWTFAPQVPNTAPATVHTDGRLVAVLPWGSALKHLPEIEANARRIVACVNACAGISTADLETVPGAEVGTLKRLMDVANDAAIDAYIAYQRGERDQ